MYKSGVYEPFIKNKDDPIAYHSVKLLGWGIHKNVPYWVYDEFLNFFFKLTIYNEFSSYVPIHGVSGGVKKATLE